MVQRALFFVVCVLAGALVGCARADAIAVSHWSLVVGDTVSGGVLVPEHFDDRVTRANRTYSIRSHVVVPPQMRARMLTFAMPLFMSRCRLFANGDEMAPLDVEQGYRGSHNPRFRIPPEVSAATELDLELKVENLWLQSAWLDVAPRLSATQAGDAFYLRVRSFNTATAVGALITATFVFFAYAIIFALERTKVAYAWFAAEAAFGCIYPAFQLGILTPIVGVYDGPIMTTGVTAAIVASMHFVHAHFNLPRPHRAWNVPLFVCALASCAFAGPFALTRVVAPITVASIISNLAYQSIVTGRQLRRGDGRVQAFLVMMAWSAISLFGSVDFLAWLGLGEIFGGYRGACLGIFSSAALHSVVLSFDHLEALRRSAALNVELAARVVHIEASNAEVVVLNAELRRQIAARSEQLASVLSRSLDGVPVPTRAFTIGEIVDGRYRVVRAVGEGGMGAVYEVARVSDGRRFALKLLTHARESNHF
jgi:hypothetical protein